MVALDPKTKIIINQILEAAQENMKNDGSLYPVAFVGKEDGIFPPLTTEIRNQEDKEEFANMIRMGALVGQATWVMVILESWMRQDKSPKAHDKFLKSGKKVSEMPDAKEVVLVTLETATAGTYTALAEIHTDADGKKSFDMPKFEEAGKLSGVFSNLLPGKSDGASNA